jgi:glycosyltransferase involved in cell wall biosynthesis
MYPHTIGLVSLNNISSRQPKVSVIIPLYNKAPYIKRALDSVLSQTMQDFEIVVVGGNSTDGGENIVQQYSDSRIRFIREIGKGVSAARNQGVNEAYAEIVAFLDADDEWLPEFLETIMELRVRYPYAGMYGTGYLRHGLKKSWNCYDIHLSQDITEKYFEYIVHYPEIIKTSSSAYDREKYLYIGGFPVDYPWNEDAALFTQFAIESAVVYCSKICAVYYDGMLNNTSIPTQFQENPLIEYIQALPKNILASRQDQDSLNIYCELTRKSGYMRNYSIGYLSQAKHQLSESFHKAYWVDLMCMRVVSLIPECIIRSFQKSPRTKKIFMYIINRFVFTLPSIFRKCMRYLS